MEKGNCTACGELAELRTFHTHENEERLCKPCEHASTATPFLTSAYSCKIRHYSGRYWHFEGLDPEGRKQAEDTGFDAFNSIRSWIRDHMNADTGAQICALCGTEGHERCHMMQLHNGAISCICEECWSANRRRFNAMGEWNALIQRDHGDGGRPHIYTDRDMNFDAMGHSWAICALNLQF